MKTKFYLIILLFLGFLGLGQIVTTQQQQIAIPVDPGDINQINPLQNIFTNLEKDRIPNGLLLDAAIEFAHFKKYDGTIPDSSYTSSKLVVDVYNTLLMSRLSANSQITKTSEQFTSDWKNEQQIDIIPLGGVFYRYSEFSEITQQNSKNTGDPGTLVINNNQIQDKYVNGIWQNPYEEKFVFALAPSINSSNKFNFKIKLPDNLFLSNQSTQIQKIEYKLSDNQPYQLLPYNQLINANYTAEGTYHWTFKLTLNSGQILYSHTLFTIDGHLDQFVEISDTSAKTSNLDQYTKKVISNGLFSRATLYIQLAPGHTQITKPLIVAEGFDMGNIIAPTRDAGLTNINNFKSSLIYQNDSGSGNNYSLYFNLNDNYDIIYVDWNNGVDYIQNNAALLKKAIQWVNDNKAGTIKNVVLGQSMGGLIARYALKDMEDNGINHDTQLFISHDSPHLGANIPLSIQYMLINVSKTYIRTPIAGPLEFIVPIFNQGISINDIITLTDTPAARQMLINYVNKTYQIDNTIHNNWQNELKSKGYPQQLRKVAISNGSECGTDQTINDLLRLYKETGEQHLFSDILGVLLGVGTGRLDMIILASLPGSSKYVFDFTARPMINLNENKQLYSGSIKYKKKILWFINAQVSLLSGSRNQPSNIFPIDKYGGGKFILAQDELPGFIKDNLDMRPFSFIPTPSAVDYKFGNVTLGESDYQKSFSPVDDASNVPFANFVAEKMDFNNDHISFSQRNGQFFINQLSNSTTTQNQTLTTAFLCGSKVKIGGEALLCGNNNAIYTTGFAPNIQWSVINGQNLIDITGPSNQPQISITPKSNANGYVKLQAYLAGDGASNTVTKDIWIGKPLAGVTQINNPNYYNETHFYLDSSTLNFQDITNIQWTKISSNPIAGVTLLASQGSTTGMAKGPNNSWTMEAKVDITNSCGTFTLYTTLTPPAAAPCETFSLAKTEESSDSYAVLKIIEPPCSSNRTVTAKQGDQYQITVANSLGTIVISKTGDTFDLQSFSNGVYVVNISKDNNTLINQTLIKN